MCVLSLALSGAIHTREDLETACENNPDGFGYAIHTGRHILRRRSMDSASLIDRYMEDRKAHLMGPAMFHARIATSGKVDNSGCHPFFLPSTSKVCIGHNGILPLDMTKIGGWKSDTRFFVEDIVRDVDSLSLSDLVELEKWMGKGNKMVILSADRSLPPFTILNEKQGDWDGDIWWSNSSYKWSRYTYTPSKTIHLVADYGWSNKDAVPSILKGQEEETSSGLVVWHSLECQWCDRPISDEDLEEGICSHCDGDLLDEIHVDSAFCNCYQCQEEQREEMHTFLSLPAGEESNF